YYVSTALVTGATKGRSSRIRIPAGDLETVVLDRLRIFFANRAEIFDGIGHEPTSGMIQRNLSERAREIATELETQVGEKTKAVVTALVHRVEIRPDRVQIDISRSRLIALLNSRSMEMQIRDDSPTSSRGDILTLTAPAKLTRVGREMKMLVEGHNDQAAADPSLLRIIARAHDVQARLIADTKLSVHDVARQERVSAAYIYIILRLPWLAPDITTAIVNGRQPPQLNAKKLKRLTAQLPSEWAEQRALLGFR
ncbi:MAG: hypothetical protein WBF47_25895, partial [Xanthobacteraceae bacterium]